jgi:hypothetical protein
MHFRSLAGILRSNGAKATCGPRTGLSPGIEYQNCGVQESSRIFSIKMKKLLHSFFCESTFRAGSGTLGI